MLSPCDMVKEDYLSVLRARLEFLPFGAVARVFFGWVHVYYFSVSLVSEQQTSIRVGVYSEVGRVKQLSLLAVPVKVAQVSWLGPQFHFSLIDGSEVLGLESVSQVDVA